MASGNSKEVRGWDEIKDAKRHGVGRAVALVGGACRPLEEFSFYSGGNGESSEPGNE